MSYDGLGLAALEPQRDRVGGSLESNSQGPTQQTMSPMAIKRKHPELGRRGDIIGLIISRCNSLLFCLTFS